MWTAIRIAAALVLMAVIVGETSLEECAALWRRVSAGWMLPAVVAFGASIWGMTRRYWVLLGNRPDFRTLLPIVVMQTVAGNVLTTAAGVASYVAMVGETGRIRMGESLRSLVLARCGDLIAAVPALAVSSGILWAEIAELRWLVMLLIAGGLTGATTLAVLVRWPGTMAALAGWIPARLRASWRAADWGPGLVAPATGLSAGRSRGAMYRTAPYAVLLFGLAFAGAYCQMRLFDVRIGVWPLVFVVAVMQLVAMVPIQVFGGLGVHDFTALYLYGLFGLSAQEMAPVVLGGRLLFYAMNFVLLLYIPLDVVMDRLFGYR